MELTINYEAEMKKYGIQYNELNSNIKGMIRKLDNVIDEYEELDEGDSGVQELEDAIVNYDKRIITELKAYELQKQESKRKEQAEIEAKNKAEEEAKQQEEQERLQKETPTKKRHYGGMSWKNW